MKKSWVLLFPLALTGCMAPVAMGGASVMGLNSVEERGLTGVMGDQTLRAKVNVDLLHKYEFSGIGLTVYRGRVLLTGNVPTEQIKQEALAIVRNTEGVRGIIDGLKVHPDDDFGQDAKDSWITVQLKTALYMDQDIYAPNYVVHTFDKVVYVFGTATTDAEAQKVLAHAREISGIRNVVNLIEISRGSPEASQQIVLPPSTNFQEGILGSQ